MRISRSIFDSRHRFFPFITRFEGVAPGRGSSFIPYLHFVAVRPPAINCAGKMSAGRHGAAWVNTTSPPSGRAYVLTGMAGRVSCHRLSNRHDRRRWARGRIKAAMAEAKLYHLLAAAFRSPGWNAWPDC
jgi:hypothetical protein